MRGRAVCGRGGRRAGPRRPGDAARDDRGGDRRAALDDRLGAGPVSLIGPNLLLVLLGISGQLERHRWVVAASGAVGTALLGLCWGTDWTVPGVHRLTSGVFYPTGGPLTDIHIGQLYWREIPE